MMPNLDPVLLSEAEELLTRYHKYGDESAGVDAHEVLAQMLGLTLWVTEDGEATLVRL